MKWKTILIVLLVAAMAGCQVTMLPTDPQAAAKAEAIERIANYELVRQEQQLIFDIMRLRHDAAVIQKAMNLPPPPSKVVVPPPEVKE